MEFHIPSLVGYTGPKFSLELRLIDGTLFLFHGEEMLEGVVNIMVEQVPDDLTHVTITLLVAPPAEKREIN